MTATAVTSVTPPEWLALHGGELRRGVSDSTWLVLLNGSMQNKLTVGPAGGRFTCAVTQANNGRRLDKGTTFATADAALQGGLEQLREALGW